MQCFEYNISWHINAVSLEYESNPFEYTNLTWSCNGRMKADGPNFFAHQKDLRERKTLSIFMTGMTYEKGVARCVTMIDRLLVDIMQNWFEVKSNKTFRRCRKASKRIL